jgi:hypothetical protein
MSFTVKKAKLNNNFLGINTDVLGEAVQELKPCGLKVYLYLSSNKDGFKWTLNPSVFAAWLKIDYSDSSKSRAVRKIINDGVADLIEKGYIIQLGPENYEFSEQKVPN